MIRFAVDRQNGHPGITFGMSVLHMFEKSVHMMYEN